MTALHNILGWVAVAANGIAAVWALIAHRVEVARTKALWIVTFGAQGLIVVEGFIGAATLSSFEGERPGFHMFYAFMAITGVMMLYGYRSYEQLSEYRYLLYGAGGAFITGLLIRTALLS